ncbi:hypothetical protein ES703_125601 [subsurface metagenome]
MRLVVKKGNSIVSELQFDSGPIYIGRHSNSQVFLPDRTVSRQHAVIFTTQDGKWMAEDLDSANKTYLNDEAIHKAEIKTGDCLRIADFTVEVNLEDFAEAEKPIHVEDTLTTATRDSQIIVRRLDVEHAPDITLPAKRAQDFLQATEAICRANGLDEVLQVLLNIILRQFGAYHTWGALRNQATGPMTCHAGRGRDGQTVELSEIKLNEKINQAVEKGQFLLLPQVSAQIEDEKIRSAMIAPIIDPTGCFGVLYVDNAADREQYSLSDLDYLMLLAIHTAAILENF